MRDGGNEFRTKSGNFHFSGHCPNQKKDAEGEHESNHGKNAKEGVSPVGQAGQVDFRVLTGHVQRPGQATLARTAVGSLSLR